MARKLSPGVHTIRIKKPGGGTRMQRVNVLKSGKFKFIKNVKGGARPKAKKVAAKPRGKARRTSPGRRQTMARRKMSLPNRLMNAALLLLAFARPISLFITRPTAQATAIIVAESTAGLVRIDGAKGRFNPQSAIQFYGPVIASFALFEVKKMAMKKFRF